MTPSCELRDFVAGWEALRLRAYDDGVGITTIGYGHTEGVRPGDTCTREQAELWLTDELESYALRLLPFMIREPSQQQFDAMLSLAYNCGVAAIGKSSLMRKYNEGDDKGASDWFLMWNRAGGKMMPGLSRRRAAERAIYLDGDYSGRP